MATGNAGTRQEPLLEALLSDTLFIRQTVPSILISEKQNIFCIIETGCFILQLDVCKSRCC